jgi:hypothetical protein
MHFTLGKTHRNSTFHHREDTQNLHILPKVKDTDTTHFKLRDAETIGFTIEKTLRNYASYFNMDPFQVTTIYFII